MDITPELLARSRLSHGIVLLCASLAVVDAPLNREEFGAFRALFPMPAKRDLRMRGWLQEGTAQPVSAKHAGEVLIPLFGDRPEMLEEILSRFVALAWADNILHPLERNWLKDCTFSLRLPNSLLMEMIEGIDPEELANERKLSAPTIPENPYRIFGLAQGASLTDVKRAWQRQIRTFHPDAVAARGLPLEDQQRYGRRMTEINVAYDKILRLHGAR